MRLSVFAAVPVASATLSFLFILALMPTLQRYVTAQPNARSSHTKQTPQGGGLAVIAATILTIFMFWKIAAYNDDFEFLTVLMATAFIAFVGMVDDLLTIKIFPRLALQALAVGGVLASLPHDFHLLNFIPVWLERSLLFLAGLWFVNLVNFMDGLDLMTVAEIVPVTAALAAFGIFGFLPTGATLIALSLCGSMVAFAYFNKPIAKLFLGDAGSLPIGLLIGWCLLQLAGAGHLVAACILPLYYLMDSTVTLIRRIMNREAFWVSHRSHFYQRATVNGFSVLQVITRVALVNVALVALAAASIIAQSASVNIICLIASAAAVTFILTQFAKPQDEFLQSSGRSRR